MKSNSYDLEILTTNICNFNCDFCDINNYSFNKINLEESIKSLKRLMEYNINEISLCGKEPILDKNFLSIYNIIKNKKIILFSNCSDLSIKKLLEFNFSNKISLVLTYHSSQIKLDNFISNTKKLIKKFNIKTIIVMNETETSKTDYDYISKIFKFSIKEIFFREPIYDLLKRDDLPNNKGKECIVPNIIFFNFINNTISKCFCCDILNIKYNKKCECSFCSYFDY